MKEDKDFTGLWALMILAILFGNFTDTVVIELGDDENV